MSNQQSLVHAAIIVTPRANGLVIRRSTTMAASVTIIGNLTSDIVLGQTNNNKAVTNFSLAYTPRRQVGSEWVDGQSSFYDITAWDYLATNLAASARKGDRLIVTGRLVQQNWTQDGQNRRKHVVIAEEIGMSLRFATAEASRVAKSAQTEVEDVAEVDGEDVFAS